MKVTIIIFFLLNAVSAFSSPREEFNKLVSKERAVEKAALNKSKIDNAKALLSEKGFKPDEFEFEVGDSYPFFVYMESPSIACSTARLPRFEWVNIRVYGGFLFGSYEGLICLEKLD